MNEPVEKSRSPRRAVLDLAPLELDCMNTLWPMGEGTVRDIRDSLADRLPRAYTTIMTIMDRLARKGVVERRKVNRAYVYRPNLSVEQARTQALGQVIANFFGGSKEALIALLGQLNSSDPGAAMGGAEAYKIASEIGDPRPASGNITPAANDSGSDEAELITDEQEMHSQIAE